MNSKQGDKPLPGTRHARVLPCAHTMAVSCTTLRPWRMNKQDAIKYNSCIDNVGYIEVGSGQTKEAGPSFMFGWVAQRFGQVSEVQPGLQRQG